LGGLSDDLDRAFHSELGVFAAVRVRMMQTRRYTPGRSLISSCWAPSGESGPANSGALIPTFSASLSLPASSRAVRCLAAVAFLTPIPWIADDQQLIRAGFRMILAAEPDIEVVGEATTGAEAVALTRELRPDVVLMDIRMPELDGSKRPAGSSPGTPRPGQAC
jgi:hypothetical protein